MVFPRRRSQALFFVEETFLRYFRLGSDETEGQGRLAFFLQRLLNRQQKRRGPRFFHKDFRLSG